MSMQCANMFSRFEPVAFCANVAPVLLIATMCLTVAGCIGSNKPPSDYLDDEFGTRIRIQPGWVQMESRSVLAKRQFAAPAPDSIMYYDADRDPYRYFLDINATFENFQSFVRLVHSDFVVLDSESTNLFDMTATRFTGFTADNAILGLILKNDSDSYFFVFSFPRTLTNGSALFDDFQKGISISPSPNAAKTGEAFVRRLPTLATSNDIANAIRYGNELLMGRDSNVHYYNGAMQQFAAALAATFRQNPRPVQYETALAQLRLCFFFRQETFYRQRRRLEQALGLGNKSDALDAADCIMQLFPDRNVWQFKFASQKWDEANRIRFDQ